jgi:glycosyltransferase involved in cell wall biosynthesis
MTDKALRVALVIGTASGGTANHVRALAVGCHDAGLSVSAYGPEQAASLFDEDIAFCQVPIADRPRPLNDAVCIARLRAGLRSGRPDVVHAHGLRAGAFAGLAITGMAPTARPALAVSVHNAPPFGRASRVVFGLLERICARRADIILCASNDLRDRMVRLGAPNVEQFDVPAEIAPPPTAEQMQAARADVAAGGCPVVLAIGRLTAQKGFDVLIDAAARWQARTPAPVTVIAGNGPLAGDLASRARTAGADVRLLGRRQDVAALLAIADVVAVPSRWEARSLVVQEAMQAGRPIVATNVGGIPDLTGTDGAILVPAEDPAALAAAVANVLDDPAMADRLGETARVRSASFPTQKDSVGDAEKIYARLAAGRPRRGG